jgi:hypothetical protein
MINRNSNTKKYKVYLLASDFLFVDAEDEEEAKEVALEIASQQRTNWQIDEVEEMAWAQR